MPVSHSLDTKKDPFSSVPLTDTILVPIPTTRAKRCAFQLGLVRHSVPHISRSKHRCQTTNIDRILYQGSLDLAVYNRVELKSSDHRPVFALFSTVVWIVDPVKQDALARLLLENVTSTSSDEKLDDKLAALVLQPSANDCMPFNSVLGSTI